MSSRGWSRARAAVCCLAAAAVTAGADVGELPAAVYVEDDPAAAEALRRADAAAREGRNRDAAAQLERVLEEHGGGLVVADTEAAGGGVRRWVEARSAVRARLRADPALGAAFRERSEPAARRALAAAGRLREPAARAEAAAAVARRHPGTAAAREAALTAAGLALEAGDLGAARRWLDGLADGSPDAAVEAIASAAADLSAALRTGPARATPAADPGPVFGEAAWTHWLAGPGGSTSNAGRGGRAATPGPVPAVAGPGGCAVYLNDGDALVRLDGDAGRQLWRSGAPAAAAAGFGGPSPAEPAGRGVLRLGDAVLGVVGRPAATRGRGFLAAGKEGGGPGTRLLSVDAGTGEPRWAVGPDRIAPGLEGAELFGTPLATGGEAVVVLLRRSGRAGFTDFRVAGVDAADGSTRWERPVSSVAAAGRGRGFAASTAPARPAAAAGGRVYLGPSLGVAGVVDAGTGGIAWLRAPDRGGGGGFGGGGSTAPLPTPAGLLLPRGGPGGRPLLLGPEDGRERPLPGPLGDAGGLPLRAVAAVRAGGSLLGVVAVVGGEAVGLDPGTLGPRWSTTIGDDARPERAEADGTAGVAGVAGGPEAVVVAGGEAFRLRWSDGALLERRVWPTGATFTRHPGGGWLVGQGGSLSLFDRPGAPLGRLAARVRAAAGRGDPRPGLALAHRGVAAGEPAALIAGAEAALAAANDAPTAGEVLRLVDAATGLPAAARRRVLEGLAVGGAGDPVPLAFVAAALSAEEGRLADAAARLQGVIDDPALAAGLFTLGGVTRRAGLEARERLRATLAAGRPRGEDLYAPQREAAAAAAARAAGDADALAEVARRFPFASAAADALVEAAGLAPADEAGGLRRWAYRAALSAAETGFDPNAGAAAAGAAAALVVAEARAGDAASAIGWVRRFGRELPDARLPLPGGGLNTNASDRWPRDAAAAAGGVDARGTGLPRLAGPLHAGERRHGRLAPSPTAWGFGEADPTCRPPGAAGGARVLLSAVGGAGGDDWEAVAPDGGRFPGFRFRGPEADAVLLLDDGPLLVLYSPTSGRLWRVRPPAPGVDAAGVAEAWDPAPLLAAVPAPADEPAAGGPGSVGGVARDLAEARRRAAQQQEALQRMRQRARPGGGAVVVRPGDAGPGGQVVIRRGGAVERLGGGSIRPALFAAATADAVVVADATGRVVSADPATGRVHWARRLPVEAVTGLALTPEHAVLRGVEAPGTPSAAFRLLRLDPLTGDALPPDVVEAAREARGVAFSGEGMFVAFDRFLAAYDLPAGTLRWRAPRAEDEPGGFSGALRAGAGVVVAEPGPGGATAAVHDAASGVLRARVPASHGAPLRLGGGRVVGADGVAHDLDGRRLHAPAGPPPPVPAVGSAAPTATAMLLPGVDASAAGGVGRVITRLDRGTGRALGVTALPPMPGGLAPGRVRLRVVDGLALAEDAAGVVPLTPADAADRGPGTP